MRTQNVLLALYALMLGSITAFAQQKQTINLHDALAKGQLSVVHRTAKPLREGNYRGIRLSNDKEEGLAWISNISFSEGTIEFDVRGKDVFQQSFVGVAFHGQNDSTYEAVYFRPFNFYAKDSVRYIHAVQYVAHPTFTWKKLRDERNGQFEKAILNAPNPNSWFHAKVVVDAETIQAFIDNRPEPILNVQRLQHNKGGKLGLFTGDGSGGDFASLVIAPLSK